jgi:hypothetical protein
MAWITPITDRTSTDVDALKQLLDQINLLGWDNVDQSVRDAFLLQNKGALNYSDLNRIEDNVDYVKNALLDVGLDITIDTSNPNWQIGLYIILEQMDIIRNNINLLKASWHVEDGTPDIVYNNPVNFEDINTLEKNLLSMKLIYDLWGINIKPMCGQFNCGQNIIL